MFNFDFGRIRTTGRSWPRFARTSTRLARSRSVTVSFPLHLELDDARTPTAIVVAIVTEV